MTHYSQYSSVDSDTASVPVEATDGNFWCKLVVSDVANVTGTGKMLQLRDINQNTEDPTELFVNGDFSSDVGWTLAGTAIWGISGGKLNGTAGTVNGNATKAIGLVNGVFRYKYTIDSITGSVTEYISTIPSVTRSAAGTYEVTRICNLANIGFRKPSAVSCVIGKVETWRILGNHAVQVDSTKAPDITDDYISFNGTDQFLKMAVKVGLDHNAGTFIAIVKRPSDSDFVLTNDPTGILNAVGSVCSIGSTFNQSAYYQIDKLKAIYWHKSTDANVKRRLNNYYAKLHGINQYVPTVDVQTVAAPVGIQHRGFPGMCMVGNRIYTVYRYAPTGGHNGTDGSVASKYSDDYGFTWSAEEIVYDGLEMYVDHPQEFIDHPTAVSDCRDQRILVTNDNYLLMTGIVVLHDGVTIFKYYGTVHRIPIVNGVVDWANKVKVTEFDDRCGGGRVKKGADIYVTTYVSTFAPVEVDLYKSSDNGINWTFISKVTDNGNEASLNFVNDRLYCFVRPLVVDATGILCYSDNFGATWTEIESDYDFQGMGAITLLSNKWLVVGRQCFGDPHASAFILMSDLTLDSELYVLMVRSDVGGSDYGYAEVVYYNGWYYFTWYDATTANQTAGIYFAKIKGTDLETLALT